MVYTYNPSYSQGRGSKVNVRSCLKNKTKQKPNYTKNQWGLKWYIEALSSIPCTSPTKKK
jgi:hypothetical protein